MQSLKRAFIWLKRIGHGRGFGVQSPNDYRFLRNVINERLPYYQYDALKAAVGNLDRHTRKMCQLYFRLSNYAQADGFLNIGSVSGEVREYVLAACARTRDLGHLTATGSLPEVWEGRNLLVRCAYTPGVETMLRRMLQGCGERSVIVVEGIHASKEARQCWDALSVASSATIAYDLYHCGILLKENRRYKKKYFVNF